MKKKRYMIFVICLILLLLLPIIIICWKKYKLYEEYRYPSEKYFGKNLYFEIIHTCSKYESEVGNIIVNEAMAVSGYTGAQELSEKEMGDVGALSEYYYFNRKNAVTQDVIFRFVTCRITEKEGHIWVVTEGIWYDSNGEKLESHGECLTLWYIEKQGDKWYVVQVEESP